MELSRPNTEPVTGELQVDPAHGSSIAVVARQVAEGVPLRSSELERRQSLFYIGSLDEVDVHLGQPATVADVDLVVVKELQDKREGPPCGPYVRDDVPPGQQDEDERLVKRWLHDAALVVYDASGKELQRRFVEAKPQRCPDTLTDFGGGLAKQSDFAQDPADLEAWLAGLLE